MALSIRELSGKMQREEIAFKVAEEIVLGKFGHMEPEKAAEQAIRTALAIFTEGLTAAPIQGIAQVKIKTNADQDTVFGDIFCWTNSVSRRNRPSFNFGCRRLRTHQLGLINTSPPKRRSPVSSKSYGCMSGQLAVSNITFQMMN